MKYAAVLDRLADLGGRKWNLYERAQQRVAEGHDVIELTIGEPDVPTPDELIDAACSALRQGRTAYSSGRGESGLRNALAARYTRLAGRSVTPSQVLCFPGTQTALYAVLSSVAEAGNEVLVGDPMYATYEGVVAASGAALIPVPLYTDGGFSPDVQAWEKRVTENTVALLLNSPHNPTGVVMSLTQIRRLAELAAAHDLWLIVDEVYDELVFSDVRFESALVLEEYEERIVVLSSVSKSHAAPGFRSGWCVGSEQFCERVLPLSETMLFGNQPFIADMTAVAVSQPSEVAAGMADRFSARAKKLRSILHERTVLRVNEPQAGMFALIDVSATGWCGDAYALDLLENANVGVMPGSAFGQSLTNWVRVALTVNDQQFEEACFRIVAHACQFSAPAHL